MVGSIENVVICESAVPNSVLMLPAELRPASRYTLAPRMCALFTSTVFKTCWSAVASAPAPPVSPEPTTKLALADTSESERVDR